MPKWMWYLIAGVVVWYVYEQNKIKLAANAGVTKLVNRAGEGGGHVIDEASSALGRFFGGLFGGSGSSSSDNDPSYGADNGYSYRPDQYDTIPSWGDSGFTG